MDSYSLFGFWCGDDSDCWQVIRYLWEEEDPLDHNDSAAIGVSLAGFASNISFLLIARAIQGVGMSSFPLHLVL